MLFRSLHSPGFRVKVLWDNAQLVAARHFPIKSPWLQPHLGSDADKFVGVVWRWRSSYRHEASSVVHPFFWLRDGCCLFDPFGDFPSATNNVKPALGGVAAAARRRHGLEVEDEGHLKVLVVISFLLRCFVPFGVSFNDRVLFAKKMIDISPFLNLFARKLSRFLFVYLCKMFERLDQTRHVPRKLNVHMSGLFWRLNFRFGGFKNAYT